jgi:hypothetical protein
MTGGTMRFRSMRLRRFQFEKIADSEVARPIAGHADNGTTKRSMIAVARRVLLEDMERIRY